jgi:hypothetical protein
MSKARFNDYQIGAGPTQAPAQTPEERSKLADTLSHRMIEGLTVLSLCCANLRWKLRSQCGEEHLEELKTIERSVATLAELTQGLLRCAQPLNSQAAEHRPARTEASRTRVREPVL